MYKIYQDGRRYGKKLFQNYEQARQYVRKLCRQNPTGRSIFDTSNPMIGDYGYSIKRV